MCKKVLSLLLALCLLLAPISLKAQAETLAPPEPPSREFTLENLWGANTALAYSAGRPWKDGAFSNGVYQGYYAQLNHTQQVIYDRLAEGFSHPTKTVSFSLPADVAPYFPDEKDNWSNMQAWMDENFFAVWTLVYNDHPEISWMLGANEVTWADWVWDYDQEGNVLGATVTGISATVTHPWYTNEIYENPQLLTQAVEEAVASIGQPKASRAMTVRAIHDYVCNRITYQVRKEEVVGSNGKISTVYYDQLAFSGLTYPYEAVCSGYTMAFKLLCDQYGIPCVRMVGHTDGGSLEGHAWNYVLLEDGKWYAVDTTWDDDPLRYNYFLLGSDTTTIRGMPFYQDHVLEYGDAGTAPELNPSAYPYVEAELSLSSQVTYGEAVSVQAENIQDRLGRPVLEGEVQLCALGSGELLATAAISDGRAALTYDTTAKALPAGEHTLLVRCAGGDFDGAVLGSFSLTLSPAPVTARLDAGSPLTAKDFDGSAAFSGLPLVLEGVRPEDADIVTATAAGTADNAQAGERLFTGETITMDGLGGSFYQVSGPVTGTVTIRKILPELAVRAFPPVQNQGEQVSLIVRMRNTPGGFPSREEIELLGPDGVPLELAESDTPGVYKAAYTLPASLKGGEALAFTAAVAGADNYLDTAHQDCVPAGVTVSSRRAAFEDVTSEAWYSGAVSFVYNCGLMSGISSTRFAPKENTSRGMVATILYQMAGSPAVNSESSFTDVPAGAWYEKGVAWAAGEGVVSGYGGGRFGPNEPITREQFAQMLYKFADSPEPGEESLDFVDAGSISSYAYKAVNWAVNQRIIGGKSGKRLDPKGKTTRAETAQMLLKYYEKMDG